MKLNDKFIKHTMDEMTLVVPVEGAGFNGVVKGNKSVAAILDYLENDTDEETVVRLMCERFDGDPERIRADVAQVIGKLREIGAIDE